MSSSWTKPPLLPGEVLRRVLRLASADGHILLWLSGFFAILSAVSSDVPGAIAGCLAAGAGAIELHGVGQLRARDTRGLDWLVRSQLVLLATILLYCAYCVISFDFEELRASSAPSMQSSFIRDYLEQTQLSVDDFLHLYAQLRQWGYVAAGVISIFYQGGMALYFQRRRDIIERSMED